MSTFGLYFRSMQQDDANALRARLNALAAELGYTAAGGPTMGDGNLAELLRAIDRGEVTLSKKEKRTMAIEVTITINKQGIIDWINEDDADTAENYANLYAAALQKGLAELHPGATIEVELTDVFDHRIEVDGINGEGYERLLAELEQDYEAVCADLAEWDWLPD